MSAACLSNPLIAYINAASISPSTNTSSSSPSRVVSFSVYTRQKKLVARRNQDSMVMKTGLSNFGLKGLEADILGKAFRHVLEMWSRIDNSGQAR